MADDRDDVERERTTVVETGGGGGGGVLAVVLLIIVVLVLLYTYVFTILQLHDYSLILGSLGMFLALEVVINFSKKIKW